MSAEHDPFHKLELLNAEIDVLIDEERYKEAENKLGLSKDTKASIAKCFDDPPAVCTQKTAKDWRDALSIKGDQWPIEKAGVFQLKDITKVSDQKCERQALQQGWSALFWAKLLRAKILEQNTDCYLGRLDEVVAYLERNLPPEPSVTTGSEEVKPDFKLHFYFLMELSAASIDHGSIGYATRAGRILKGTKDDGKGFRSFHETAKRWIALNEGISCLHLRDYHKASLEFNDIIWKYDEHKPNGNKGKYYLESNEKNLIYYPSILYRATILLKQQFSYHAVKTLKVKDRPPRSLYKKMRKDMLVAEAYRQMERRKESVKALNKLPKKHKLFPGYEFSLNLAHVSSAKIPEKNTGGQNKMKEAAARTRYVELVVSEFLEIVKGDGFAAGHNSTEFRYWVEGKKIKRNDHAIEVIAKGLKAACEMYGVMHDFLPWVENNPMDRTGYYTQMAELLAWSARILDQLQDGEEEFEKKISGQDNKQKSHSKELSQIKQDTDALTGQLIKITRELVKGMVDSRKGSNPKVPKCPVCSDKKKIRLARLSGEDYQSFVDDITRVLSAKGAKKWFGKSLNQIKQKFTRAVTEKEKTKGEDLHIHRLKLRNELTLYTSTNACSWCMDDEFYKTFFNNHFSQLTPCRLAADDNKGETIDPRRLCALDYDKIMETHENHFRRHLSKPTKHESPPGALNNSKFPIKAAVHFFGLRRWNSISPAEGRSSGGGYLLFRTANGVIDLGVAIDPGFDFIKNLFHCGFSLVDIDVILLSHSHADHVRDFESMVNLLKELDDRTGQFRKVNVLLTLGTYVRLQHVFDNKAFRRHVEPLVIDIEKDINRKYFESLGPGSPTRFSFVRGNVPGNGRGEWLISLGNQVNDKKLTIWPTRAYHDDYSNISDSFGFILDIPLDIPAEPNQKKTLRFGYTGDTKWVGQSLYPNKSFGYHPPGISQQYANCDVLLIHLGSLIDHKNKQLFSDIPEKWGERCEDIVRGKNHPYLPGLIGLLNEVYNSTQGNKARLILLGEFGEELRGTIRTDLVNRLNRVYESGDRSKPWCYILPVDIGLDVACQPPAYTGPDGKQNDDGRFKFWCAQCRRFHPVENIAYRHYGQDEAIFYLCRTCDKTTSSDVLQDRLRHLYDVGRTLRTDDE